MRSRLLWWCGDFATPAALYLALRDSPAYLPTLEAPIRLFARAFALDGDPARAAVTAQALAELEPAPGALCYAETIAFWRAMALLQADQPEAALDLLEPAAVPLQPPPFGEHRARYLALRLAARTALAQPVEALRAETLALLPIAPAPVALELLAAWCAAAPDEPDWRRSAGALARRMQDSLADQPLLQQRYGRRWAELLAGTDGAVQSSPNDGSSASGSATTASASQSAGAAPGPR